MSQFGARGRANAGQTFDQILAHYYDGTTLGAIDGQAPIRVQLAANYTPSLASPARLTALGGGWTTSLFPGQTFGAGTYVEMWQPALAPLPPAPEPSPTIAPESSTSPAPSVSPGASPTLSPSPSPTPSPTMPPVPAGHWVVVVYAANGSQLGWTTAPELLVQPASPDTIINIPFKDSHPNMTQFRGSMRLRVTGSGGLQAVNVVPLDTYLRGVVAAEMPASWHLEAVKTQAVAARTYAWPRLGGSGTFDILPTAGHQVYRGVLSEHPRSDAAIAQTAGLVLLHNGRVITAYFHASSGGHTEHSEFVWPTNSGNPGTKLAYIRGKPDVDANGVAYDSSYGKFAYQSASFTMAQLSTIMSKNSATDVGQITSLTFDRGVSGRVYRVTLVGTKGTKTVKGGTFKNTYNSNRLSGGEVNSTMFWLRETTSP